MKRALPVAALLVAVLAVGLCLAQPSPTTGAAPGEKPKEEPKFYVGFGLTIILREDSSEPAAKKSLDAALDSVGFNVGNPSWVPATLGSARISRKKAEADNAKLRSAPYSEVERRSTYKVYSDDRLTLGQIHQVTVALSSFMSDPSAEKVTMSVGLSNESYFPKR